MNVLREVAKAITGAGTVFLATFLSAEAGGVTSGEWVYIGVSTLLGGVAVWAVPNKQAA